MQFRETSKKSVLCLLFLLLLPLQSNEAGMKKRQAGTLAGSMAFVDESEKKWLANAAKVTVELGYKGQTIPLVSNELGDYIVELAAGTYELKSARDTEGKELRFSISQHKSFKVKSGKTTRFDVMLLRP
jgi:hypothetical protein